MKSIGIKFKLQRAREDDGAGGSLEDGAQVRALGENESEDDPE